MGKPDSFAYICAYAVINTYTCSPALIKTENIIITQNVPSGPFPVIHHFCLSRGNHCSDFFSTIDVFSCFQPSPKWNCYDLNVNVFPQNSYVET